MDSKSTVRTLDIFEAFANACEPLTLTEVSNALNMPLSSCLHILRTLERRGYAYYFGARQGYYPTQRMFRHAKIIAQHDPILKILGPRMVALRDRSRETVVLAQRVEKHAVIIETQDSPQTIRYSVASGDVRGLHNSALGKALLGGMPAQDRTKLLRKLNLDDPAALEAELAAFEEQGWYNSDRVIAPDLFAIVVHFPVGSDVFAMGIAGPIARMLEHQQSHIALLKEFKAEIGELSLRHSDAG